MEARIILAIDEELKEKIKKKAKENGLSISAYLRMLMIKEVRNDEKSR